MSFDPETLADMLIPVFESSDEILAPGMALGSPIDGEIKIVRHEGIELVGKNSVFVWYSFETDVEISFSNDYIFGRVNYLYKFDGFKSWLERRSFTELDWESYDHAEVADS